MSRPTSFGWEGKGKDRYGSFR